MPEDFIPVPVYPRRKKRRSYKDVRTLEWQIYQHACSTGAPHSEIALKFKVTTQFVNNAIHRLRNAIIYARGFDPKAKNLQREMLKFMPLAATALEENLIKAEPRVTVAYLQGVGALIPRQEVTTVTDEEREAAIHKTVQAMNPRLRAALNIDAEITTVKKLDKEENPPILPPVPTDMDP